MGEAMDPDLPKGQQYRAIFPDRGLKEDVIPQCRASCLKDIRNEAAIARHEQEVKDKVEKAKWTSVGQNCDYDQYRQLLLGAELNGMAPGQIESIGKEELKPINRRTRRRGARGGGTAAEAVQRAAPTTAPKDRDEFEREWRSACRDPASKYAYMMLIPPATCCALFKEGVEEHLGSMLAALDSGWGIEGDAAAGAAVAEWMMALPEAYRFDLAAGFLSESEKAAGARIFDALMSGEAGEGVNRDAIVEVRAKFGV